MTVLRMQCSWLYDTAFPRDRMVITPHFELTGAIQDAQDLCEGLADALDTWSGATGELSVKSYDAQGTPPVYPNGEAVRREGVVDTTNYPRELALCLSFYADRNVPRQRGRLYLPIPIVGFPSGVAVVPVASQIQKAMDLGPVLAALGGSDVDWVVYSRADDDARRVTNFWVDNEWDVQRSRGLRATTRQTATTGG